MCIFKVGRFDVNPAATNRQLVTIRTSSLLFELLTIIRSSNFEPFESLELFKALGLLHLKGLNSVMIEPLTVDHQVNGVRTVCTRITKAFRQVGR